LLQQCQHADLERRLEALEDLRGHGYLDRIPAQFLLDHLNSSSIEREQLAIIGLMRLIEDSLPVEALMAILEENETTPLFLRLCWQTREIVTW
jgi:hypothetical protein